MSRYSGPIYKKAKKLNFSLLENNQEFKKRKRVLTKRSWKRKTEFGSQLQEKQKLKFLYDIREKQLHNLFKKTLKQGNVKSTNLIIELEKRLDNVVYRLGLATTRRKARQIVNHGHILLNNKKVDIPSHSVKVNDVITVKKDKFKKLLKIEKSWENQPDWQFVQWDSNNLAGKLLREPEFEELNLKINIALIVEYYNRFA